MKFGLQNSVDFFGCLQGYITVHHDVPVVSWSHNIVVVGVQCLFCSVVYIMNMRFLRTNFRALIYHFFSGFSVKFKLKSSPMHTSWYHITWSHASSHHHLNLSLNHHTSFSGFPAHIRSISRVSFSHQRSRCSLSLYFSGFLDFFQVSHDFFSSFFATDFPFIRDFPWKLDFPPIRKLFPSNSIFSIFSSFL